MRARLVAFLALVLEARPAHGETALEAGHEKLPVHCHSHVVPADVANEPIDVT